MRNWLSYHGQTVWPRADHRGTYRRNFMVETLAMCDTLRGRTDDAGNVAVPVNNGGKSVINVTPRQYSIDPAGRPV